MASPVDADRVATTAGSTAALNKACALPTGIVSGDLLILVLRSAAVDTHSTPAGWTQLVLNNTADPATVNQPSSIWYKLAAGTEGTSVTVNGSASAKYAAIAYRITGAISPATQAPQLSAIATGSTFVANPGAVTPTGGSKDYLFLWLVTGDGEALAPTTPPTNYANLNRSTSGTSGAGTSNVQALGYSRQATTASEDPAALDLMLGGPTGWSAWTMAIHPSPLAPLTGTLTRTLDDLAADLDGTVLVQGGLGGGPAALVTYNATGTGKTGSATTTLSFDLVLAGSLTQGAALVGLAFHTQTVSAVSVSVGGVAATLVSGADSTTGTTNTRGMLYGLPLGAASGTKAVAITWTGANYCGAAAITIDGADQATPFGAGTIEKNGTGPTASVTIPSAANALTIAHFALDSGTAASTPTQTARYNDQAGFQVGYCGSTAAGAATVTHQWATSSGGNAIGVSAAPAVSLPPALADLLGAATGTVGDVVPPAEGALTRTLDELTRSLTGTAEARGTGTAMLAAVTLDADATAPIAGTTTRTLDGLTRLGTGTVEVRATLTQTLAGLTTDLDATADARGTLGRTLDAVALDAEGVGLVVVAGSLTAALDGLTATATAVSPLTGTATGILADATIVAQAAGQAGTIGTAQPTLASLTLTGGAASAITGTGTATLDTVDLLGTGTSPLAGVLAQPLDALILIGLAVTERYGALDQVLAPVTAAALGVPPLLPTADPILGDRLAAIRGRVHIVPVVGLPGRAVRGIGHAAIVGRGVSVVAGRA